MDTDRLRRQIAFEAARQIYYRQESDYRRAVIRIARRLIRGWVRDTVLPTNAEVRQELQRLAEQSEGARHELHTPDTSGVAGVRQSLPPENAEPTGGETMSRPQPPNVEPEDLSDDPSRFPVFRGLLIALSGVSQSPQAHPEGDALTHSLQVYDLARDELPYDEEFQLAALLHDVGKSIDRYDHERAAVDALEGLVTDRTSWLIEFHTEALKLRAGTLGARARRRLTVSPDYETLTLLADCDLAGRQRNIRVTDVDDALDQLRELAEWNA
ncbi:HD domain-containing protein [Calycomorphotria hydatis]|uniref:HD domain-containing protein n=1 Tax=Calycomorphotria hydatis TaxID=2528027 RepID=A0A517T3B1_9PLAN|nr:HD domain-containing protein [Calycomorphotria hydatis]QDT62865.1 hypothetical protein V22_00630 [Calycomorphotria hydatis]